MIHGGSGNVYTNNICDLRGGGGSTTPPAILVQQQTAASGTWPMTGNEWENNIIVCSTSGANCGGGYKVNPTIPAGATVADNAYYNYGGGASVNHSAGPGGNPDSNPTYENPQVQTCPSNGANSWAYLMQSGSPVIFLAQSSAWGQAGYWGPQGWTLPHTGTLPSYRPTC
jgi:hypothetical protein